MKKIAIGLVVLTAMVTKANAQKIYALGGANFANITTSNSGQTEDNNTLVTFNAGLLGTFGISKVVDLETGLLLTGRGAKAETYYNNGNDYVKAKFNPLYVELPVNLVVKFPIDKDNNIFVNAGPYVAVGVGGKSKLDTKFGPLTSSSSENIKFSNDDPFTSQQEDAAYNKLKRFDYGINLGGGIALKGFTIRANYGLGLAKINSTAGNNNADEKNKYRTASISVGIPLN
ncbi:porin family protein [Ferruginibacter yonginensis]|uniref:Porin family protein n=1 Tax=Ferruginibacter yonginensis TaxID=1310416 RepID=A0ABV8QTW0_9BACT